MSTDIRCFVEFVTADSQEYPGWTDSRDAGIRISHSVFSLSRGPLNVGASYTLFGALAGIRTTKAPIFVPRGIPAIVSGYASAHYFWQVSNRPSEPHSIQMSPEEAERWVGNGTSYYAKTGDKSYSPKLVSNPELHTFGWLYTDEVEKAISQQGVVVPAAFSAIVAAMRSLSASLGNDHVRLIFAFHGPKG